MNQKGVTLIEMLVAVAIFSIIVVAISGLFISSIRAQGRILATQELLDQTSYVLEYMGRAIRMAKKELNCSSPDTQEYCYPDQPPQCLTDIPDDPAPYGFNYEVSPSPIGDRIRFINYDNKCQEFFYENGQIKTKISIDRGADLFQEPLPLTSGHIQIESLQFIISGESQGDDLQPKVTVSIEARGREMVLGRPKIQIQTSISQRILDVEY